MAKAIAKKSTKQAAKKSTTKTPSNGKREALHSKLINLFCRPNGATLAEIKAAGYDYAPAVAALRIAEGAGCKTSVVKKKGELTRYVARSAIAKRAGGGS
jgi:hypothetical protein